MGQIDKGVVVTLVNSATARVIPYGPETVSYDVTIPVSLRGYLVKGTPVVYATFADQTGVILCRADGVGGMGGGSSSPFLELRGTSVQTKPTTYNGEAIPYGSTFTELDTADIYYFDGTSWHPFGGNTSGNAGSINAAMIDFTDADLHVRTLEADGEIRGAAVLGTGDVGTYQAPVILATAEEMAAAAAADPEDDGLTVLTAAEAEEMGLFEEDDDT